MTVTVHDSHVTAGLKHIIRMTGKTRASGLSVQDGTLCDRGYVNLGPWRPARPAAVSEDLLRSCLAGTAVGCDAKLGLQLPQIAHTRLRRLADLLVSDGVADAYVHNFNNLRA